VREELALLGDWSRSDWCGELRPDAIDRDVTIMGWVHGRRDHGGVVFLDVRDRTGLVQVVLDPERGSGEAHTRAADVRLEYVVAVRSEAVGI